MSAIDLFRRRCRVVVDTIEVVSLSTLEGDAVDPATQLTVRFSVTKSLTPEPDKAEVSIFNLNRDHRSQLSELGEVPVSIEAGYEQATSVIFLGKLRTGRPVREGADVIVHLSSSDGGPEFQRSRIGKSYKKGTPTDVVLKDIVAALGVPDGNIKAAVAAINANALGQMFASGTCLHGRASDEMTRVCRSVGLTWSTKDGKLQFLKLREALATEAVLLSPETGLVDAPSVDAKGVLKCKMLIAPDVVPGRLLVLRSEFLEGQFRIEKTVHTGDTYGTDWYIDIEGRRY